MTREEFIETWQPAPGLSRSAFVAQLDSLLSATESATRKAALEEAASICERDADNLQAYGHYTRATEATRLAVVIRGLIDQPKEKA